jgi:hypothetical protein
MQYTVLSVSFVTQPAQLDAAMFLAEIVACPALQLAKTLTQPQKQPQIARFIMSHRSFILISAN